jgi:hypothetical protein
MFDLEENIFVDASKEIVSQQLMIVKLDLVRQIDSKFDKLSS